jgi:transcriptional regulator GlxA family with amidase domain
MVNISFIVDTGCSFAGASGLIHCFNIANQWHAEKTGKWLETLFRTQVVSLDTKPVQVSDGFKVTPEGRIQDVEHTDVVIVPAYLPYADFLPANSTSLLDWIVAQYKQGALIASPCSGSFVLAETGLLDGRLATTHWYYTKHFKRRYPKVLLEPDRILTRDKGLICSGSISSFYYLALHLIESFYSPQLASQCSKIFLVDPNKAGQSTYAIFNAHKEHNDSDIRRAQELMESNYSDIIKIENIARKVGISSRHFVRRFKTATDETPLGYLQKIRIEKAKDHLEMTRQTVDEITQVIGYENSGSFRKLFKGATGLSPSQYRSRFARNNNISKLFQSA